MNVCRFKLGFKKIYKNIRKSMCWMIILVLFDISLKSCWFLLKNWRIGDVVLRNYVGLLFLKIERIYKLFLVYVMWLNDYS